MSFLDDKLLSRQLAADTILTGTEAAAKLLVDQITNVELEPKERRAAAVALLNYAGMGEATAKTSDTSRPAGANHLLAILNARPEPFEVLVDPFD